MATFRRHVPPSLNWDPRKGERLGPAWAAILRILADGEWHDYPELVDAAIKDGAIHRDSVAQLLRDSEQWGATQHRTTGRKRTVRITIVGGVVWLEGGWIVLNGEEYPPTGE